MKYAVEGIYRNGVVELLEDVPVHHKPMKVFVLFREEFSDGYEIKDWLKLSESAFKF